MSRDSFRGSMAVLPLSFLACPCSTDGEACWVETEEGLGFVGEETAFFSCFFPDQNEGRLSVNILIKEFV